MREIRFKFWLGHTKKMTYDHRLQEVSIIIPEFTDDIIPLQFTGLKDKNKKEIYEGDIVEAVFNYHGKPTDIKFKAIIIYNSHIGAFQISYPNSNDAWVNDDLYGKYFLTVIGNIYENKDLIP